MTAAILPACEPGKRWLIVVAAPAEARAVARGIAGHDIETHYWALTPIGSRFDLLLSGVGKSNAAGSTARYLDPSHHAGVINLGVAGALPSGSGALAIGDAVLATASVFADEGIVTPDGFVDIASIGFGPFAGMAGTGAGEVAGSPVLLQSLGRGVPGRGRIATVSACAGTDERAHEIARLTRAQAEAMEGAAVGLAVRRVGGGEFPFAEVRVISNSTGDRERQRWDLRLALTRLEGVAAAL